MRKRIIGLLMAFTLANSLVMLTGCGANATSDADLDHLGRVQRSGKLVIAMEGQWAPWTYHDENGDLVGYDT